MLRTRLLTVVVLMPIIAVLLIIGGWAYAGGVALTLAVGGIEFVSLMRKGSYQPFGVILVATIVLIVLAQAAGVLDRVFGVGLAAFLIISMTAMLAAYGDGDKIPVVN